MNMGFANRSGSYVRFLIYLAVVVLVNVAGITLFFRADLTANKMYSISKASQKVVSTLSEPLTINVFFTKNLPAPHNNTERYLRDLLGEYAAYANRNFNYRFYDVSPEEGDVGAEARGNQDLATSYGIHSVQVQVVEEDEVKFQKAFMGVAIIHGDLIERLPAITTTDGLEYELTTAIQKLNNKISALLGLRDKIQVRLFFSSSLNVVAPYMRLNELPQLPGRVEAVVGKLNDRNYAKLAFSRVDPEKENDVEALLAKHKILRLKWPELSGGKIPPGEGAIGLVMEYGGNTLEIPLMRVMSIPLIGKHYELVNLDDLEEIINESVESLIDINEDIGYLASHGALELSGGSPMDMMTGGTEGDLSNFRALTEQNYNIKEINLKEDNIPDSLNCLIVAGPKESFSDYELFQIDQFLMRGKNLALLVDAFNEVMPGRQQPMQFNQGPSYVPLNTGLEKLLTHYGITIKKSYVMDENCYKQELPAQFGGGERAVYFAPIIQNEFINRDLTFMQNIKGLVVMKISPLGLDADRLKQNGLEAHKVFSSSEKSWEMKGRIDLNPMLMRPPQSADELASYPLAYVLEGEFPSYFAGKDIPEKIPEEESEENRGPGEEGEEQEAAKKPQVDLSNIEGEGQFLAKGKRGKIFVMAASEMLKDNVLDDKGRTPNAMFIMNVLDFLNNREEIAVMRSKEQRFNPLHDTSGTVKAFVKSFNVAGLPVLVVVFGLSVWLRRRARKRRIQFMFQSASVGSL
jgi:ABC-2 type transport system permease protein